MEIEHDWFDEDIRSVSSIDSSIDIRLNEVGCIYLERPDIITMAKALNIKPEELEE